MIFLFFSLSFSCVVSTHKGVPLYSNTDGVIYNFVEFIDEECISVSSLPYSLDNPISVTISASTYTIKTGRFTGWDDEEGDFDVIEISKNGQPEIIYKAYDGIAKMNNSKNSYTSLFSRYSSNGYFIEMPVTSDSKVIIFLGQHYGTDLSRLIIFTLTDSDVKLVHNKQMAINNITAECGNFSMLLESNIVEFGYGTPATHSIYQKNDVLYFKDN